MATHVYEGIARGSAVLEAAGAYDPTPIRIGSNNYNQITFMIAYTRGGAGGAVTFKIEMSNDGTNFYQVSEFSSGTVTAGADVADATQRAEITYQATGATIERFTSPTFTVAANFYRIVCRESGAVGTPGTVLVEFTARGDL